MSSGISTFIEKLVDKDVNNLSKKLSNTQIELQRLQKEVNTEEETYKQNADINTYPGYTYYTSEVERLRGLINNKVQNVNSITTSFRTKREAQIETLRHTIAKMQRQIETIEQEIIEYEERSNDMNSTIESNHSKQIEMYLEKLTNIREKVGIPTSLSYRRKKTRIEELQKEENELRYKLNVASDIITKEMKEKHRRELEYAIQQERKAEQEEKNKAMEIYYQKKAEEEERDRRRWEAKGLETQTANIIIPEPEPIFDQTTREGRNAYKSWLIRQNKPTKENSEQSIE